MASGEAATRYTGAGRVWQLTATALSFAVFGLGGLFFAACLAPVLNLAVRRSRRRYVVRRLIGGWFRLFVAMMRRFGLIRWVAHDLERLQAPGQIIIANHPTLIDVVFLVGFLPQADCVVKGELMRNPFMRSAVRAAGYLINDDSEAFLEAGVARLKAGGSIIIFPEGTRSPPGGTRRFHRGFANLALFADAPVVPVVIHCTPPGLVKGEPWYRLPPQCLYFDFRVLASFRAREVAGGLVRARAARRLGRHAQNLFAHNLRPGE